MGWLPSWNYRNSHIVNYAAGAGTLYQIRITAHYGAGVNSDKDIYLHSRCRTDFGDVIFTDDTGVALLDYWIESKVDGDNAVFWVEVADSLESAAQTIYVYYGNGNATSVSSGINTFPFFDTGEADRSSEYTLRNLYGANLNATLSYDSANARYKVDITTDDLVGVEINTLAASGAYEINAQVITDTIGTNNQLGLMMRYSTSGVYYGRRITLPTPPYKVQDIQYEATPPKTTQTQVASTTPTSNYVANTWYKCKANAYGSAFSFWFELNNLTISGSNSSQSTGTWGLVFAYHATPNYYFRNVWVRKYTSPEPTHGAWGDTEDDDGLHNLLMDEEYL